MALPSTIDNIRYNGSGIAFATEVGLANPGYDLGELDSITFGQTVSTEKLTSTRTAAKATLMEVESSREATLTFALREQSEENLQMALLGSTINTLNQAAGTIDAQTQTWVADSYIDLGKVNVYYTKLTHGTVTSGPFAVGETVTGASSSATGKIAYVGSGYIEVVAVTGTFSASETISASAKSATLSGVETIEDVVITDTTGATRRVQGTDYKVLPDHGFVEKLSTGAIASSDEVSCDYEAIDKKYFHGLAASSVTRKLTFVTDPGDQGPRQRYTFHKVQLNLSGDISLIGEKQAVLTCKGTVLFDSTQNSGEEYYKVEMFG